jgi:ligand-binding sensor protein
VIDKIQHQGSASMVIATVVFTTSGFAMSHLSSFSWGPCGARFVSQLRLRYAVMLENARQDFIEAASTSNVIVLKGRECAAAWER